MNSDDAFHPSPQTTSLTFKADAPKVAGVTQKVPSGAAGVVVPEAVILGVPGEAISLSVSQNKYIFFTSPHSFLFVVANVVLVNFSHWF